MAIQLFHLRPHFSNSHKYTHKLAYKRQLSKTSGTNGIPQSSKEKVESKIESSITKDLTLIEQNHFVYLHSIEFGYECAAHFYLPTGLGSSFL